MLTLKTFVSVLAATALLAAPAAAVSVQNTGQQEFKIGVDHGDLEEVRSAGAGKTAKFDCPEGCGVTGPWGFSWMASGDEALSSDGKSRIAVGESGSAGTADTSESGN
jgi:hypothetical protein